MREEYEVLFEQVTSYFFPNPKFGMMVYSLPLVRSAEPRNRCFYDSVRWLGEKEVNRKLEVTQWWGTKKSVEGEIRSRFRKAVQNRRYRQKSNITIASYPAALLISYWSFQPSLARQIAAAGGRNGGWDSRDHDTFLRIFTQVIPSFVQSYISYDPNHETAAAKHIPEQVELLLRRRLALMLPGKDEAEIQEHIKW